MTRDVGPVSRPQGSGNEGKIIGWVVAVVVLIAIVSSCSERRSATRQVPAAPIEDTTFVIPSDQQKVAFAAGMKVITASMGTCDDANEAAMRTLKKRDIYKTYSALIQSSDTCESSGHFVRSYTFAAPISTFQREKLKNITEQCGVAQNMRAYHMLAAARVFDEGPSPSLVEAVQQAQQQADFNTAMCMNAIVASSGEAGFDGWSVLPGDPALRAQIERSLHEQQGASATP